MSKKKKNKVATKVTTKISNDGIENVVTGLNKKAKDKKVNVSVNPDILSQKEAENLYQISDTARKIVDKVAGEGTRKWIEVTNASPEEKESFISEFKRLNAKKVFKKAWRWSRLYGGACLLINADDVDSNNLDKELNLSRNTKINSLVVLHRYELMADITSIETDISSENFGLPKYYNLNTRNKGEQKKIHYSRLIRFEGKELPQDLFVKNQYWNDSVLSAISLPILNHSQSHDAIASIIHDFRQRILKIDGLMNMLANDEDGLISKRMEMQDLIKSIFKTDLLDKEDELDIIGTPLSGVPDLIELINNRLVVASGFPHTILLGESPKGTLNNTGDSQNRDWYDFISDQQEEVMHGPMQKLIELLMESKEGPTNGSINEEIGFDFVPLKQATEKERAEIEKIVAEKDTLYIQNQVVLPEEVRNSRFGGEKYSQDTTIDEAGMKKLLEMEEEPELDDEAKKNRDQEKNS
jgi:phage-related protein (TIGR01555 family)